VVGVESQSSRDRRAELSSCWVGRSRWSAAPRAGCCDHRRTRG
jgi:hypothetical protein